ncbi:uncharacterized protein LOC119901571, partial [Micropterus salmoides]|uniref:uncharacterized protein LOC119901571 n=1 Tax=Micropterus salmoides TaxID=27706 RepID=UPI0018EC95C8
MFSHTCPRKTTGPDGISGFLLKSYSEDLAEPWCPIYQMSLDLRDHPVALTSVDMKCFEKVIINLFACRCDRDWLRNILILTLWLECKGEDRVTQPAGDVIAAEGDTVTLGCNFETSDPFPALYWYKQDRKCLKFILVCSKVGPGKTEDKFKERFSSTLNSTLRSAPLKIQKLQLSDSAVYYCSTNLVLMKTKQRDHSLLYTCWSSQFLNTADMTPLFISVLLAAVCLECRAQKDNVLQPEGDVTAAEGETVTLGCLYNSSSTNDYLFWYKQDGNNSPKFMLSRMQGVEVKTEDEFKERFSSTLNSTSKSVPLKIQKLQLTDSAVYYCAL